KSDETTELNHKLNTFETPSQINISTFKMDFEKTLWHGVLGLGSKLSQVISDNAYLVFDFPQNDPVQNKVRSNKFKYTERVYAGYINYGHSIFSKWKCNAGLRFEHTDALGNLEAFLPELQEPPVKLNYQSLFPSAGLSWDIHPHHNLALNYGRRINRPDYNVLNPFNNQLSQLSFERGNPFLKPEIVNNLELGYTLNSLYNFKIAYSLTKDQITRLIGPDTSDIRASYINWDNLATQKIWSANVSCPIDITKYWSAYFNLSGSFINNQANYGNGAIVDIQAYSYELFQQQSFTLPYGIKAEISGSYSGPGVWGGVFIYEPSWNLNVGLQRKFIHNKLNAKLNGSDLFYESGWDGYSDFDGLYAKGFGRNDTQKIALSLSYQLGNQNVKSRKRNTGLEEEAGRVKG
ncbi:MAG: outer membrane beta-barrel family protein, partial [Saprospiraceae bacterium]